MIRVKKCQNVELPHKDELGESILNWLNHFFMSKDIDIHKITMKGGRNMLDTVIDNIKKDSKKEGMEKRNKEIAKKAFTMGY